MLQHVTALPASKSYHHGNLYEQLLNAGEQALSEMPVEKVSLREIARRAGVSHAAPQHHFASLGHLLAEIAARGFNRFMAALDAGMAASSDQSPAARLFSLGRAYLHFALENPAAYQLMFGQREPMLMTPRLAEASLASWDQLVQAAGAVTGRSRATAGALQIWSCIHGLSLLRLAQRIPPDMPLHSLVDMQFRMLLEGLKAE